VFLKECHDGPLASHGGAKCTTTFLKEVLLLAQFERRCRGVCEDLLDMLTKSDPQQEASRLVTTFTNS
jgi:hypothetical protein